MNIFVLDSDPIQAARDQCNKHVVKMILESAQMLCTALHINGVAVADLTYKPTHAKHPCTIWASTNNNNAAWLYLHAIELCEEYERRYNKVHKSESVIHELRSRFSLGDWRDHTPFALAMPDEWKVNDPVTSYRCYYIAEKSHFARWAPLAKAPSWWPFEDKK